MLTRLSLQLEQVISHDPNQRGIKHLFIAGELYRSLYFLTHSTNHVVLGTGFPVTDFNPPTESDGPPGCMVLAYSLLKHYPHRKVTIIYDPIHESVISRLTDSFNQEFHKIHQNIDQTLNAFNTKDIESGEHFFSLAQFQDIDHMIAVELSGYNKDGRHKSMRNIDITDRCGITATLFDYAFKQNKCITTGIGDGGNEVGMAKVIDKVEQHIDNGKDIACAIETKHLIATGVSNWGAEALSMGLHLDDIMNTLNTQNQTFCTEQFHEKMYMLSAEFGAADGITKRFDGGVDGMEYGEHQQMYKQLCDLTKTQQDAMFPVICK